MTPDEAEKQLEKYEAAKLRWPTLPRIEVSRQEFVAMLVAGGLCQDDAEFQARMSEKLGAEMEIDGKMISIAKVD